MGCFLDGIIAVNKPQNITSFEVVRRVKRWLKPSKIGHGGTLDPFAEGLMILLVNKGTRIADQFLENDKVYEFTIFLGQETDTLDRTGKVVYTYEGDPIPKEAIEEALKRFLGTIEQKVPLYSAAKVKGKRLYKIARKGVTIEPIYKKVTIHNIELLSYEWPRVKLRVHCSKGTYIRQLGADIARSVGCYGFLEHLVRTQSGRFTLEDALTLEEVQRLIEAKDFKRLIIPLAEALSHLPSVVVTDERDLLRLKHGQWNGLWTSDTNTPVRILDSSNTQLLALWWPQLKRKSIRVFI